MGVPGCIQEDSLSKELTLLKDKSHYRSKLFFRFYDNASEIEPPPERRHNREHVYRMVKNMRVVYENKNLNGTNKEQR